ncbi:MULTISPECIES: hypothetical protein [unclassified Brevundimonas]|jgi:hypothetical protein|uniref:hypothetical protein n=1 Tax=unclassified Brevundimonas TaxID=2622653 RepID=UPI003B5862B7
MKNTLKEQNDLLLKLLNVKDELLKLEEKKVADITSHFNKTIASKNTELRLASEKINDIEYKLNLLQEKYNNIVAAIDIERVKKFVSQYQEPSFVVKG